MRSILDTCSGELLPVLNADIGSVDTHRWAVSGLRILLGGTSKDVKGVERMFERLRI